MMRYSRPMSWAVASTCPSGGRRTTMPPPVGTGHRVRQVRAAAADQLRRERPDGTVDVGLQPRAHRSMSRPVDHGPDVANRTGAPTRVRQSRKQRHGRTPWSRPSEHGTRDQRRRAEPLAHAVDGDVEGTAAGVVERQRQLDVVVVVEVADGQPEQREPALVDHRRRPTPAGPWPWPAPTPSPPWPAAACGSGWPGRSRRSAAARSRCARRGSALRMRRVTRSTRPTSTASISSGVFGADRARAASRSNDGAGRPAPGAGRGCGRGRGGDGRRPGRAWRRAPARPAGRPRRPS